MPAQVFTNARVKIGSSGSPTTTLSTSLRSVTLNYAAELLDKTAMGVGSRQRIAGLKDWSATLEFNNQFAGSTDFDRFFYNLIGAGSSDCWIQIKPTSSTNPRYHGYSLLESYPMGGAVGELATVSLTFQGDGNLTRTSDTR